MSNNFTDKDITFLFILLFSSFILNLFFYFHVSSYLQERYFEIGYCEGKLGQMIGNTCIDNKYILELKK